VKNSLIEVPTNTECWSKVNTEKVSSMRFSNPNIILYAYLKSKKDKK